MLIAIGIKEKSILVRGVGALICRPASGSCSLTPQIGFLLSGESELLISSILLYLDNSS